MKGWMRLAVRLYPPGWRNRYGAEFGALLEEVGPGWRDFWDVVRGALAMQMKVLWSFRNVIAACGLAGATIAALVAFQMDNRYVSNTVLRVSTPAGAKTDEDALAKQLQQVQEQLLSRSSLAGIIQRRDLDLYQPERHRVPMEDIIQSMRTQDIRISPLQPAGGRVANAFQIQFSYADPVRAQAVTRALAARMMELTAAKGGAPDRPAAELEVLDPASLPDQPIYPNRLAIAAFGLIGGLATGLILIGARRWPIVAATGIGVAIVAGGLSFLIPDRYVSNAVVRVTPTESVNDLIGRALSQEVLLGIIQEPELDLYHRERARRPIASVVESMRHDVQILLVRGSHGNGELLQIRFSYGDRHQAQAAVRSLLTALREAQTMEPSNSQAPARPAFEILDPPSLPNQPVFPNRLMIALLGLGAGLPLGAAVLWVRNRRTLKAV
jgi:uncharacterized protein involved in exopolysaccharide biosynthesis